MRTIHTAAIGILSLFIFSPKAPAALSVIHNWSMGDDNGGVAGNPAGTSITDTVGGLTLTRTGAPVYGTLNGSTAVSFNNTGSAHNVAATEYYSSALGDVNPTDPARWGIEAIVRINLVPATNQELAVFEMGAGPKGILLETFGNGAWAIHQSNVAIMASTSPVLAGQTQHLAIVRDSGNWQLWVDGLLSASFASADYNPDAGIRIGAGNAGTGDNRGFNGLIDSVRIFEYTGAFDTKDTLYPIPEPTAVSLSALGAMLLLRRRR